MIYFAIGFTVYLIFNIITFKVYSKKKEITKKYILFFIYVYYTILAGYLIQLVDNNIWEIAIQTLLFTIAGGLYMIIYYRTVIVERDEQDAVDYRNV